jgi:putative DNA primase/helicase
MTSSLEAERIAKILGGRRCGRGWIAHCPAHDDRNPSLSLLTGTDGKVLVRCHAGCDQAQVIDALRARGLWKHRDLRLIRRQAIKAHQREDTSLDCSDTDRTDYALRIWRSAVPASNTLAENYLQSRSLRLPSASALRFHSVLKHPTGGTWPALVALVSRGADDTPLAIHRTFLARDGSAKAPVDPQKMMLGPCRGGAVRLAAPSNLLMVGEGIETCIAAMQATGNPAWAALSTSGLKALDLPKAVHEVLILADGDDPGEAAARECALRWKLEGRHVRIARPPHGHDFNDMLTGHELVSREGRR